MSLVAVFQLLWLRHRCVQLTLNQSWTAPSRWPVRQWEQLSQSPGCTTGPRWTLTTEESFLWTMRPSPLILSSCLTAATIHVWLPTQSATLPVSGSYWIFYVSIWNTISFKICIKNYNVEVLLHWWNKTEACSHVFFCFNVWFKGMFTCLDGPEVPWISGPATIKVGENVTLICHAPSNPPCSYMWIFNGSVVATTSTYVTPPFTTEMNRVYTCVAHNNVTDKNSTAYKMIFAICEGFFFVVVLCGGGVGGGGV